MWSRTFSYHPVPTENKLGPEVVHKKAINWKDIVLGISCLLSIVLSIVVVKQQSQIQDAPFVYSEFSAIDSRLLSSRLKSGALDLISTKNIQEYSWWSDYSDPHDSEAVDQRWLEILPAHGIVAVNQQWVADKQLPKSLEHPQDPSKSVYIIDAYHQLHCLVCTHTFHQC